MHYIPRLLDEKLAWLVGHLPAVVIDGAKSVGKTASAQRLAQTVFELDQTPVRETLLSSPRLLEESAPPVLVDEWQRAPEIWDRLRRAVDADDERSHFMLTGSAYPLDASLHSGAGRIVHLRLRPFSLSERGLGTSTVSLNALLESSDVSVVGQTDLESIDYLHEILKSGFPAIHRQAPTIAGVRLDGYLDDIVERRVPEQGVEIRKPQTLRNWLRAYAAATASTASYETILNGATPGEDNKPAKRTTLIYRDVLASLWLIDQIDPWLPMNTTFAYLGRSPKHHLVDPGLAARLLGLTEKNLLKSSEGTVLGPQKKSLFGRLFESLIAQSLQTYCLVCDAKLYHLRTSTGAHEIDFIVERGRDIVAIEVKFAATVEGKEMQHLQWLERQFPEYRVTKALVNVGARAYTRDDGIHVIPAALFGP
ncbi:MAG: DUF4143 domain-containing protein [Actinomycetes bacterium]|nr:DUF4143 domain-containing protein [Actinomycetes bacterium]